MKKKEWEILVNCARMKEMEEIPVALIIDSPWLPGYAGITAMDYFTMPDKWMYANKKVKEEFPEAIFLPDFWVEYGMATEPSGFGCKINFYENSTPTVNHIFYSEEDLNELSRIKQPNPLTDGLMPLALNLYKNMKPVLKEEGEEIKIVAARGPLTIATHLMGLTEFLTAVKLEPDLVHQLLKMTAKMTKDWLEAQMDVLDEVEGIMVLDDVAGFFSPEDYNEFAHPYLKSVFNSFSCAVKIYHNDTDNPACYEYLEDMGINIFNFTYKQKISKVRELVGSKVCLLGNIPPLHVLTQGDAELVARETMRCMEDYGSKKGIIISAGGGASPGMPGENFKTMIRTVKSY